MLLVHFAKKSDSGHGINESKPKLLNIFIKIQYNYIVLKSYRQSCFALSCYLVGESACTTRIISRAISSGDRTKSIYPLAMALSGISG
jgi:hypothetical protein